MNLFDAINRENEKPALYADSAFKYLNDSARNLAVTARDTFELWFSHYPTEGKNDLYNRFRSDIDSQHYGALFELFLYELFLKIGCEIKTHPEIENNSKNPDFCVKLPKGEEIYIEAIVATDQTKSGIGSQNIIHSVIDGINLGLNSPNFFINMEMRGIPKTQPSIKKLIKFLDEHLKRLDPDQESEKFLQSNSFDSLPRWYFSHNGWDIEFQPIPKSFNSRGDLGMRPVGRISSFDEIKTTENIKNAIIKKGSRYGNLRLPYIVAVNSLSYVTHNDMMEALFGEGYLDLDYLNNKIKNVSGNFDGAWFSGNSPRYTRISGVLIGRNILPLNLSRSNVFLYHNPWAKKPLSGELNNLSHAIVQNNEMQLYNGQDACSILNLSSEDLIH